jgi:hypothetical protein
LLNLTIIKLLKHQYTSLKLLKFLLLFVLDGFDIGLEHAFMIVEVFVLFQKLIGHLEGDLLLKVGEKLGYLGFRKVFLA